MSTKALSDAKYFVTFIDDHSRETWIFFSSENQGRGFLSIQRVQGFGGESDREENKSFAIR